MIQTSLPLLHVSRPALGLLEEVGYGHGSVSFETLRAVSRRSKPTVGRHLGELVTAGLVLHVGYAEYAIPRRSTIGRLLVEPSPYVRSLLLHEEILGIRGERKWAFACAPIKSVFSMELDHAIPVLTPDERLKDRTSRPYPDVLWYRFVPSDVTKEPFGPSDPQHRGPFRDRIKLSVLKPGLSLALLSATLDPRYLAASKAAAARLGIEAQTIARRAKGLHPESPPLKVIHPNTVVFPEWLQEFWQTARSQHSRAVLDEMAVEGKRRRVSEADEGA